MIHKETYLHLFPASVVHTVKYQRAKNLPRLVRSCSIHFFGFAADGWFLGGYVPYFHLYSD